MSKANCDIMRNWASAYGAAVRQRTVRQETTMAKHGNLPEFICQSQLLLNQWMKADHLLLYKMKHNQSTSSLTTLIDMINLAATVLVTTMTNRIPFFYEIENRFETKKLDKESREIKGSKLWTSLFVGMYSNLRGRKTDLTETLSYQLAAVTSLAHLSAA